jgi:hypothetical protein
LPVSFGVSCRCALGEPKGWRERLECGMMVCQAGRVDVAGALEGGPVFG